MSMMSAHCFSFPQQPQTHKTSIGVHGAWTPSFGRVASTYIDTPEFAFTV